jgi:phage-related tail protein
LGIGVELVGMEHSDTLAKLAANVEEYNRQIEVSKQGAGSMRREYQAQLQTMNTQFKLLGNTVREIGVDIGTTMLPAMQSIVGTLKSASGAVSDFAKEHPELVRNVLSTTGVVIGLTAALGFGRLAVGGIAYALGAITPLVTATGAAFTWLAGTAIPAVVTAAGTTFSWLAGTAIPAVVGGIRAIGLALAANPIGLMVTGLATAAYLVYQNWEWVMDKVRAVGALWSKIKAEFGFSSGPAQQDTQRPVVSSPPTLPALRAPGGSVTNNVDMPVSLVINQQPGQDSKALADEVIRRMKERESVRSRSMMIDRALGY